MIKRIHNLLKSNADIIVSVFLITAAFSLSLLFSSGQASSRGEDAYFTEIPENTYTPAVYNNRTSDTQDPSDENAAVSHGYALYINGEKIGASSDEAALETMLGESAQSQASVYGDYRSVEIQDEVAYGYAAADTIDSDDVIIERLSEYKLTLAVTAYDKRESELPFTTVYVDDSEAYEGVENVSQAGKTGVIENTYEITYTNGVKTGERLVSSAVIKTPVREVISRGIKLRTETVPTGLKMFIMPYNGGITSEYGSRYLLGGTFHGGLDIAAKKAGGYCYGDYIMAAGDGTVVFAENGGDFGNLVIIEHKNGVRTYYAHQSEILVDEGDTVRQGENIGRIGSTGQSTGPHVHFEVRLPDGNGGYYRTDPKAYIIGYESYYR